MLKINVVGNITKDFELRTKPGSDFPYAIIRVASDRRYNDRNGNPLTDFVSIKVRGRLAEKCAETLKKGSFIAASGDLETVLRPDDKGIMRQNGFYIKAFDVELLAARNQMEEMDEAELEELLSEVNEIVTSPDIAE